MKRRRDKIDIYINGGSWRSKPDGSNENANRLRSIGGMKAFIAENEIARHTLKYVYPIEVSRAHVDGFFHIHDLGSGIVPYCAGWSLQDLLLNGFNGVRGSVQDILVDLERIEEECRSALEMYKVKAGDIFIVEEITDEGMVAKELRNKDEINNMIQFAERNGDKFWKGVKLGLLWLLRKEVIDYEEYYRR